MGILAESSRTEEYLAVNKKVPKFAWEKNSGTGFIMPSCCFWHFAAFKFFFI